MAQEVLTQVAGRVATVTLNRPPLNLLDIPTIEALSTALEDLEGREDLQLLLLRGAGDRAFSAGVAVQDHTPDRVEAMLATFHHLIHRVRNFPAVTLAVVQGHCLGGGMELAGVCDLLLASDEAHFGQPEVNLGCYPPVAAVVYPDRLGLHRTFDLLLTGRTLTCEEAERLGFVTWRVPAGELEVRLGEVVSQLTAKSAAVTRLIKKAVLAGLHQPFQKALAETERIYLEELCRTQDMAEGIAAFLEKREPRWKNR